ncbi:MAG: dihydroorotase [Actinomycetota bacterium]
MPELVIRGGTLVDQHGSRAGDVLVAEDGTVQAVGEGLRGAIEIDATGCVVTPGFVDLHTHLREPGKEEAETVESGSRSAVAGGYTCVLAMPNTTPTIDCASVVRDVQELGRRALCDVEVSAAITVDRAGEQLTPMAELAELGVRWFTDDGTGVQDDHLMRLAMEYSLPLGVVLAQHAENSALSAGGVMHEGAVSSRLGLPGQPAEAEELMVMRDIALARLTGARVHVMHVSTAGAIAMIRAARAGGIPITAEVTPHHLALTDECCSDYDAVFKVHPPLRTSGDVDACRIGLGDGTLDCIATDHAPHTPETKDLPFDEAPPGMIGLETAFSVAWTELDLPLETVLDRLSWTPARLLGAEDHGVIEAGRRANLTVIDTEASWTVDPMEAVSRSRNTPFAGRELRGRVIHTVADGELVFHDGEATR